MLEKEKLTFHSISLEDKEWMTQKLREDNYSSCEYAFANNFMWSEVFEVEVGQAYDCGIIRYRKGGEFSYSFPFGNGDKKRAVELLRGICAAHEYKLHMYPIEEKARKMLIEWFPGEFELDTDRDSFDYVYAVEKLALLKGKKLHGKRNHIARFKDEDDWSYESLTRDCIDECRKMAKLWIGQREDKWNEEMEQEMRVLEKAFVHFDELDLFGGVLRKKGEIVAFTIGERLNADTMVVHFEKAYPELQGAYPMINQQFVLDRGKEFTFVNREEDTGDLGLRKAKMSYYPDMLIKKYRAVESHVVFANEMDEEAIIDLWKQCFGDTKEYIQMYLGRRFTTENMLVIHDDGRPVAMASFLPVQIMINGETTDARYVYAVGTLPDYRKKGYATEIIRYAFKKYQMPLILQPAEEMLERYYAGMGFVNAFEASPCWCFESFAEYKQMEMTVASEMSETNWSIQEVKAKEYKALRDAYFTGEGYVYWDEQAIDYAIVENAFCGGEAWKLSKGEKEEILMCRKENDRLRIVETTFEEQELKEILPIFMQKNACSKAFAENAGGMVLLPKTIVWEEKEGYLNLTLG